MKQKMREYILKSISSQGKDIADISTFGLINEANGRWMIKIYWKKMTEKGKQRLIDITLDHKRSTMDMAMDVMLELREEQKEIDVDFNQKQKSRKGDSGW